MLDYAFCVFHCIAEIELSFVESYHDIALAFWCNMPRGGPGLVVEADFRQYSSLDTQGVRAGCATDSVFSDTLQGVSTGGDTRCADTVQTCMTPSIGE